MDPDAGTCAPPPFQPLPRTHPQPRAFGASAQEPVVTMGMFAGKGRGRRSGTVGTRWRGTVTREGFGRVKRREFGRAFVFIRKWMFLRVEGSIGSLFRS